MQRNPERRIPPQVTLRAIREAHGLTSPMLAAKIADRGVNPQLIASKVGWPEMFWRFWRKTNSAHPASLEQTEPDPAMEAVSVMTDEAQRVLEPYQNMPNPMESLMLTLFNDRQMEDSGNAEPHS